MFQDDDFLALNEALYRRQTALLRMLPRKSPHLNVIGPILHALYTTQTCADLHLELFEALVTRQRKKMEKRNVRWADNLNVNLQLLSLRRSISHDTYLQSIENSQQHYFSSTSFLEAGLRGLESLDHQVMELVFALRTDALLRIVLGERRYRRAKVLRAVGKGVLGVTPVGPIIEALQIMATITNPPGNEARNASDFINRLDDYTNEAFGWAVVTQHMLDRLTTPDDYPEPLFQAAAGRIIARNFHHAERFWQSIGPTTPA